MMHKLLVKTPSGRQEVVEVSETGGYFDQSRVLWDERVDGELPAIDPGKMHRVGDELVILDSVLPEHVAAIKSESVPAMVTMRQCELALIESGLLSQIETFIATQSDVFKTYWKRSTTVNRNHALVAAVQAELAKTDDEMDDLFILAGTFEP